MKEELMLSAGFWRFQDCANHQLQMLWKPNEKLGILVEGDALAAPQGRAEDVLVAATYWISDHFGIKAGYRLLESGADNDEVYNFALFHFATAGIFIYL